MAELSGLQSEFDHFRRETQNQLEDLRAVAADVKASARTNNNAAQRNAVLEEEINSLRAELHAQRHEIGELSTELREMRDEMGEVRGQARGGVNRELQHEKVDHREKEELWRELSDLRNDMAEAKKTLSTLNRTVKDVSAHPPQPLLGAGRGDTKDRYRPNQHRIDEEGSHHHHHHHWEENSLDLHQKGPMRDMRLVPVDEEHGSFELRRRSEIQAEANAEWEELSEREQEQMLLVMLSYVHTMLAVSPMELVVNILHEKDLGFILLNARAGLLSRWLGFLLAIFLVSGLPLLYGNYVAPVHCKEMCGLYHRPCSLAPHFDFCALEALAQSPMGLLLGPAAVALIFVAVAVISAAFWVLDTCAAVCCCGCCRDMFVEARVSGRGFLYKLFFYWLRDRMPYVEFGGPFEFVVVCLSYPAFVFSLAFLSLLRGHVAIGVPVAYMMGEAYCMALNWLFAPPAFARSVVGAELPRCFPENFWSRLRDNKSESFSLSAAEASEFRELIWPWWLTQDLQRAPCTPRHIRKLYVPELKRSLVWDGAEHGSASAAAHAHRMGFGFGLGGSGRRQHGYSGLRSGDEDDRGRRPLHSTSSNFRENACVGIYGNIAGMHPDDKRSRDWDAEHDHRGGHHHDDHRHMSRERSHSHLRDGHGGHHHDDHRHVSRDKSHSHLRDGHGGHHSERDLSHDHHRDDAVATHDARDRDHHHHHDHHHDHSSSSRDHPGASSSSGGGGAGGVVRGMLSLFGGGGGGGSGSGSKDASTRHAGRSLTSGSRAGGHQPPRNASRHSTKFPT